ncbi:MAG: HpaII family restriction endonuclease [Bacteroidaceae bacterium]|nr:HpaII family restriction endonuclease [Bacteroidaceae bacterium]
MKGNLFIILRFETPSTSRHNFGEIYQEDGEYFLKLNLQVRFK